MSGNLIDIHRKLFEDGHTDLNFEDWLELFESDQDVQDDAYSKYTGESAGTNEQAAWNSNLFIKSNSSDDTQLLNKTQEKNLNKLGSKNNPIQGIPSVKDAKLGLYYQNKNTNQLYVFADNKYHEIDPAKTYNNAPVNKERPFGTYFTQTEVDLYSVSRAADNKQIQDQTVLPGYMFNQKAADEGILFDGFKFPEANYRYKEENGKAAWSKSTDGDKTF
jgi:hypothetical protein